MLKQLPAALVGALLLTPLASAGSAEPPASPANADPSAAEAGAYAVDSNHTRVLFSASHMGFTTWYGEFTNVAGSLNLDTKAPEKSAVEIHLPTASVSTSNAKLDGELKSDQWFDAGKFPDVVFKSTALVLTGRATGELAGDLTFHGVTRPVTLAVKFNGAGVNPLSKKFTVGFNATGSIKRSDFGVKTHIPLIGDEVSLIVSAGFERKE